MDNIKVDDSIRKYMEKLLEKSGIEMIPEKIDKMLLFLELLYEKNQVMNLTAIRDKKGMLEKHFIDSLLLTKIIMENEKNIIDVGTGAGFPGLVLAIFYPDKSFLLVDSVRKKVEFIREVIEKLDLENVETSFERAEEIIRDKREAFDVALCRGVANLRVILEYMLPFVKVGGRFLPQKQNLNELEESERALEILRGEVKDIYKFTLPESGDGRIVLEILKAGRTDSKYPRKTGIPTKKPL